MLGSRRNRETDGRNAVPVAVRALPTDRGGLAVPQCQRSGLGLPREPCERAALTRSAALCYAGTMMRYRFRVRVAHLTVEEALVIAGAVLRPTAFQTGVGRSRPKGDPCPMRAPQRSLTVDVNSDY